MQKQAILVLGMHRGGTSALAGALVRLGVDAPRTLMPPDASNELGYWESDPIRWYHERLLESLGTSWDSWTPVVGITALPQHAELRRELETLVAQEYGSSARFVVKDPRISRLVPFWVDVLAAAGITPACVIIVRSPAEVARSLAVRDDLPPQLSALLWLRHMLDAEAATRAMPRSIVRYADLLSDWPSVLGRVATDLGLTWPAGSLVPDHPVVRFLRPDLRHQVVVGAAENGTPSPVSEWIAGAVAAFDRLAARESFDHCRILDDIRMQLDAAASNFGAPVEHLAAADRRQLAQAQSERRFLEEHVTTLEGDLQTLRHSAAVSERDRHAAQERSAALERERDRLRQEVARLEAQRDQLTRQIEAALHERDSLSGRLHELGVARQQIEARSRELDAQLAATRHHLDAVLSSLSWQITAPARAGLTALERLFSKTPETGR